MRSTARLHSRTAPFIAPDGVALSAEERSRQPGGGPGLCPQTARGAAFKMRKQQNTASRTKVHPPLVITDEFRRQLARHLKMQNYSPAAWKHELPG